MNRLILISLVVWASVYISEALAQSIKFKDVSVSAGISDPGINAAGPNFGDYDNDGDVDIYVTVEATAPGIENRLWENDGAGNFSNVALERGIENTGGLGRGSSWGDYDNDGDLDLLVSNMPPSGPPGHAKPKHVPTILYQNQLIETDQPTFTDITREAGMMRKGNVDDQTIGGIGNTGAGIGWVDFDNDGHLDIMWRGADYDIENALFHNNGNGTFTDITKSSGIGIIGRVIEANSQGAPSWADFDNDGDMDALVTNEGDANILFLNDGNGNFRDVSRSFRPPTGFALRNPGNSNGSCIGDIDNDGDLDVYLPNADQANRLVRNDLDRDKGLTFTDITASSGTDDMGGVRGCTMIDFDNDGYLDLYVNNGGPSNVLINDVIAEMAPFVQFYIAWSPDNNVLYRNNGNNTFTDVTTESGTTGFGIGSGVAAGDVNNDGFYDLFLTNRTYYSEQKRVNIEQENKLFLNEGNNNYWIKLKLRGVTSNRSGLGARIKITAGDLVQIREHVSAVGYNSANDPAIIFGLGDKKRVDRISVRWPSGKNQHLDNVEANRIVSITEP